MKTAFSALHVRVLRPLRRLLISDEGLEAVEYALIAALISAILVAVIGVFGGDIATAFSNIGETLNSPPAPAIPVDG